MHFTYCAPYSYDCDISSTSDHQTIDPRRWGPLPHVTGEHRGSAGPLSPEARQRGMKGGNPGGSACGPHSLLRCGVRVVIEWRL